MLPSSGADLVLHAETAAPQLDGETDVQSALAAEAESHAAALPQLEELGTARSPTASPEVCATVPTAAAADPTAELIPDAPVTTGTAEAAAGVPLPTAAAAAAPKGLVPTLLLAGDCPGGAPGTLRPVVTASPPPTAASTSPDLFTASSGAAPGTVEKPASLALSCPGTAGEEPLADATQPSKSAAAEAPFIFRKDPARELSSASKVYKPIPTGTGCARCHHRG